MSFYKETSKPECLHWGLNPGPPAYKAVALPLSYKGRAFLARLLQSRAIEAVRSAGIEPASRPCHWSGLSPLWKGPILPLNYERLARQPRLITKVNSPLYSLRGSNPRLSA